MKNASKDVEKVKDIVFKYFRFDDRKRRKDSFHVGDFLCITAAFAALSEASPNLNDTVRQYLEESDGSGLRFHVKQRLYFYGKYEEVQRYITDTLNGPKYSLRTLLLYKGGQYMHMQRL